MIVDCGGRDRTREEMREQKQRARLNSSKKVRAIETFKKEVKLGLFNI